MSGYINVHKTPGGQWEVGSKWGTVPCGSWLEAMNEASRLRQTIRAALTKRAESIARADGPCAYAGCSEPGRRFPEGRGFRFCPEHTDGARQVLDNPRSRGGRECWPAIIPRKAKEASIA